MTKRLRFLIVPCVALLGYALSLQSAMAQPTGAANQFLATKDVQIRAHRTEQLSSAGDAGRIRLKTKTQDVAIMDFDTLAMKIYLAENPGIATWTLHISPAEAPDYNADIQVMSLESTNDWTESNGDGGGSALNWNAGESAATYFYAQTATTDDGSGNAVLDNANSLEWIDPDSGPYTFTPREPDFDAWGVPNTVGGGTANAASMTGFVANNPTPEFANTDVFTPAEMSAAFGGYASVVLDNDLVNAMLNDVNNRGIRFGPLDNSQTGNARIWDRNQSGGLFSPYLEVSISAGQVGDFDGDLDVDGADFLKWQQDGLSAADLTDWQTHYGTAAPLTAVDVVPEPSSIALLVLSSALLLGRRSSSRV